MFYDNKLQKVERDEDQLSSHRSNSNFSGRPAKNTFGNLISPEDTKNFQNTQQAQNVSDAGSNINTVVSQARYINYQNVNVGFMNTNELMEYPCELPPSDVKSRTSKIHNNQLNYTG